jgi:imidazole glycerol phosphate synthase glutamine amidotransferase subunit
LTTIVNYGAGNLRSVQNTLDEIGAAYDTTDDPQTVLTADKLILPGVGHFGQMMRAMDELGLREPVLQRIREGVPFLGICIGLQGLFEGSEESPGSKGFGLFPGMVKRFQGDLRVPHMGWNSLERVKGSRLLQNLGEQPFTYFAHSYYAPVVPEAAALCTYINAYTAVIEQQNVFAVQFHPEKSGPVGLQVMRNFIGI